MTSSNGNIFRVIGHWCVKFTGHRWTPFTKAVTWSFDVFDLRLNNPLSKQSKRRWFEMPSRSLWRNCTIKETAGNKHLTVRPTCCKQYACFYYFLGCSTSRTWQLIIPCYWINLSDMRGWIRNHIHKSLRDVISNPYHNLEIGFLHCTPEVLFPWEPGCSQA